jgi:uncharacterized membrane protein
MSSELLVEQIIFYILFIIIPIFIFYIGYILVTRAFQDMGFTSIEAIVIIVISFLFGIGVLDGIGGISYSNIYLFTSGYWIIGINTGGAIIPIILSIYLTIKNRMKLWHIGIAALLVAIVTYLVTTPDSQKGITARFPYWLLPVFCASILSIILCWNNKTKVAPLAYIGGTLGVLIGADVFHLFSLISMPIQETRNAIIGGANVFDMVFLTGILAVIVDGILIVRKRVNPSE